MPTTRAPGTAWQNAQANSATPTPTSSSTPSPAAKRSARPSRTGTTKTANPRATPGRRPALGGQDLVSERTPVPAAGVPEGGGRCLTEAAADAVSEGPRLAAERLHDRRPGQHPAVGCLQQPVVRQDPGGRVVHAERPLKAARQHRRQRAQHPDSVRQLPDGRPDLLRGLEHGPPPELTIRRSTMRSQSLTANPQPPSPVAPEPQRRFPCRQGAAENSYGVLDGR